MSFFDDFRQNGRNHQYDKFISIITGTNMLKPVSLES